MHLKRILPLFCAIAGPIAIQTEARSAPEANSVRMPPEIGIAVAVDKDMVEIRRFVERRVTRTTQSSSPPGVTIEVRAGTIEPHARTEVVSVVEAQVTQTEASRVVVRRINGRLVPYKELVVELAGDTPVVLAKPGQQIDPLFSRMFNPETLVVSLPSSAPPTVAP
jgi:hypothetical protein